VGSGPSRALIAHWHIPNWHTPVEQVIPLQHGCPRLPQVRHVPLEQTVPKLHELLPPQQGSPFPPQCWHVLPKPKGFGLQTF
jgi:hypothetical protein